MKQLKLLGLRIQNFKGIREFELNAKGRNCAVFGANGTGKTTLKDAVTWLLFGKDSQDSAEFSIKTIDPATKEPVHHLDHSVEAQFELNGQKFIMKKVYREKWTKKRGELEKILAGHTTDYSVDGVACKQKDYLEKVKEICDENLFKLLTDCRFFNQSLHWTKRREMLIELCGDVQDSDIISLNPEFSDLEKTLEGKTYEDFLKIKKDANKAISKQIDELDIRMREADQNKPAADPLEISKAQSDKRFLETSIETKQAELEAAKKGDNSGKQTDLMRVSKEIFDIEMKIKNEVSRKNTEAEKNYSLAETAISRTESMRRSAKDCESVIEKKIKEIDENLDNCRKKWELLNSTKFEYRQENICPTCGQNIPEKTLEEVRYKALGEWEKNKETLLSEITTQGKRLKEEKLKLEDELNVICKSIVSHEKTLTEQKASIEKLKVTEISADQELSKNEEYQKLLAEKAAIETEMAAVIDQELIDKKTDEIAELKAKMAELDKIIAASAQYAQLSQRIAELSAKTEGLKKEFAENAQKIFLCEKFETAKIEALEKKINDHFSGVTFRLFENQNNGGYAKCCYLVDSVGVPYPDLNSAMKVNAGLIVINVMSQFHQFSAPIFVDNKESITDLEPTDSQLICLFVRGTRKKLRAFTQKLKVEVQE